MMFSFHRLPMLKLFMVCRRVGISSNILIELILLETLSILDWDEQCAHAYGKVRNELRLQGVTVQSMDLMIGAHAIGHNMTLISNDHIFDHFKQFGLVLENWQTA